MRHGLENIQMSQISGFLELEHGLESLMKRGRPCSHKTRSELWLGIVRILNDTNSFTLPLARHLLKEV